MTQADPSHGFGAHFPFESIRCDLLPHALARSLLKITSKRAFAPARHRTQHPANRDRPFLRAPRILFHPRRNRWPSPLPTSASASLINGGFETTGTPDPMTPAGRFSRENSVAGWGTTATDNQIEIWGSNFDSLSGGPVPAYEGRQFAEIQR